MVSLWRNLSRGFARRERSWVLRASCCVEGYPTDEICWTFFLFLYVFVLWQLLIFMKITNVLNLHYFGVCVSSYMLLYLLTLLKLCKGKFVIHVNYGLRCNETAGLLCAALQCYSSRAPGDDPRRMLVWNCLSKAARLSEAQGEKIERK